MRGIHPRTYVLGRIQGLESRRVRSLVAICVLAAGVLSFAGIAAAATCSYYGCTGKDPDQQNCASNQTKAVENGIGWAYAELRLSGTCKAPWVRLSGYDIRYDAVVYSASSYGALDSESLHLSTVDKRKAHGANTYNQYDWSSMSYNNWARVCVVKAGGGWLPPRNLVADGVYLINYYWCTGRFQMPSPPYS